MVQRLAHAFGRHVLAQGVGAVIVAQLAVPRAVGVAQTVLLEAPVRARYWFTCTTSQRSDAAQALTHLHAFALAVLGRVVKLTRRYVDAQAVTRKLRTVNVGRVSG